VVFRGVESDLIADDHRSLAFEESGLDLISGSHADVLR